MARGGAHEVGVTGAPQRGLDNPRRQHMGDSTGDREGMGTTTPPGARVGTCERWPLAGARFFECRQLLLSISHPSTHWRAKRATVGGSKRAAMVELQQVACCALL